MSELFLSILNMSLTASYVILFVILIRLLLKKAPKFISYTIWGVVAFRLIIPFSFESMFSLIPRNTNAITIPQDIIYQQSPQINSGIEVVDSFVNQSLPVPTTQASVNPLQIYIEVGSYIWILGVIALIVYSFVSILIIKRQLKSVQLIEKNIFEAKNLKTPFVLGPIKPKIYLPVGLDATERGYILLHEQTHIHRKDHIIKILAFIILSIHWFNPLVWIAFMLMSTDMELSCDERVLKEMDEDIKKPYANSLLALATERHILNSSPLAFGEGNVKDRIKNVLNYRKPNFWVSAIVIITVTAVAIGLMMNPRQTKVGVDDSGNHVAQQTPLEPSANLDVSLSNDNEVDLSDIEQMNIGAEMPHLIYGDENMVVMLGTFGLLVYDINNSLVTDRISYVQLSSLGISKLLHAAVSLDGTLIYFGGVDKKDTKFLFTHQYDIRTNTIGKISQQPSNVYTPGVIDPTPGFNERYDKYFDFNFLIGYRIIDFEDSFLYLRANTDWSMKSLQIVNCQYKDGKSEIQNIFTTEIKE